MYTERRCVLGFIIGSLVGRPSVIKHSAPWLTDDDLDAVRATLATGMIACGPQVELFQQAVATAQRARGAVLTGSGTAALSLGLRALDVGPSDEVVLPSYVCASVADAVRAVGASVILADVDPDSWLMTPGTVAPRISPATKAIILVHLFSVSLRTMRASSDSICLLSTIIVRPSPNPYRRRRVRGTDGSPSFRSMPRNV